ncbi:MAG TPA: 50S ribosomal protein L23 [Candidatus Thermoplasmatota archaeon]|nr:50S ribosomal protein L23 [Candidatus Thermoplasmatota archaeon]
MSSKSARQGVGSKPLASRASVRAAGKASRPKQGVPQEAPTNASRRAANTQGHLRRSGRGDFSAPKGMKVDPYAIVIHPMVTEKSMGQMDRHNSLEFLVRRTADKHEIKAAIQQLFDCEVAKVNTRITREGKRATVVFGGETTAEEIGQRIGVF